MSGRDLSTPFDMQLEAIGERPPEGIGICLSGGGYRAMLFHLGALKRMNDAGRLRALTRVASVSGGSITAAVLGLSWSKLDFDHNGVAQNFHTAVEKPILAIAGRTLDVPAVILGKLMNGGVASQIEKAYNKHLFKDATLQDLPHQGEGPRFVILATNIGNASLWRFSQPYMRDWRSDLIPNPTLPLARAVAASSAFPPFLSPCTVEAGRSTVYLTDGGVYDNLGLEPIIKRCSTVYVSDGGGTFKDVESPQVNWFSGTMRILSTVDIQVRRLRRRQVVGALASGSRHGAFWANNTDYSKFPRTSPTLPAGPGATRRLAALPTRLKKIPIGDRNRLVNWGYACCDAALRSYVDTDLAIPDNYPFAAEVLT